MHRVTELAQLGAKAPHSAQLNNRTVYFYLELASEYKADELVECRGRYRCFNCSRPIQGAVFLYPTRQDNHENFTCSAIPHCRAACALRTVHDLQNHADLITLFHLMYGVDVTPAPPRLLLYVPGGITLAQYHDFADKQLVINQECNNVRSFLAPSCLSSSFLSCAFMQQYQLPAESVAQSDALLATSDVLGPERERAAHTAVCTVPLLNPGAVFARV